MTRIFKAVGILLAMVALALVAFIGWTLYPQKNLQPLPNSLISIDSAEGLKRLQRTTIKADYTPLTDSYQAQNLVSYCGVASSVAVLGALGVKTSQSEFFTDKAKQIRSRISVAFGGMSLAQLADLLRAHSLRVSIQHAENIEVEQFREAVEKNLANAGNFLVINYQREVLGQGKVGHISPVAAYDRATDSLLIMDTAAHKYPPTWAPLQSVYAAMKTTDTSSGLTRGYIEVSK